MPSVKSVESKLSSIPGLNHLRNISKAYLAT
jgi:hypothetical protein